MRNSDKPAARFVSTFTSILFVVVVAAIIGGDYLVAAAALLITVGLLALARGGRLDRGLSQGMWREATMRRNPRAWTAYMFVTMALVAFLVPYSADHREPILWALFGVAIGAYSALSFHRRISR